MIRAHLSKYNAFDPALPLPEAPYVLVIDQTRGDASIVHAGADARRLPRDAHRRPDDHAGHARS